MVIEDRVAAEAVARALAGDRSAGATDEAYLKLLGNLASNEHDAIEQLEAMKDLPDAIVLLESGTTGGRSVERTTWLCRRCIGREMPLRDRPRVAWHGRFSARASL